MVVDLPHFIWVNISIVFDVFDDCIIAPRSFPKLVKHAQVLISLPVSFIMLDGTVKFNSFEGTLLPRSDNVPCDSI
jgi:hypothetical protein